MNKTLKAIESNSVIDVWKREYNENAERIAAGYANEDVHRPLKQKINEFMDQKFNRRAFWKRTIRRLTIVMLLMWVTAIIVFYCYNSFGDSWYEFNGFLYKVLGLTTYDFSAIFEMLSFVLPFIYILLLMFAKIRKMKCEKAIYDAMTFDKRYFSGDICRLRNIDL